MAWCKGKLADFATYRSGIDNASGCGIAHTTVLCLGHSLKNCGHGSAWACVNFARNMGMTPATGARLNAKCSPRRVKRIRCAHGHGNLGLNKAPKIGSSSSTMPLWMRGVSRNTCLKIKNSSRSCRRFFAHSRAGNLRARIRRNCLRLLIAPAIRKRPAQIQSPIQSEGANLARRRALAT